MKILISTSNPKKLKELKEILGEDFELVLKSDLGLENVEVEEDSDTLEGNAKKKALELYNLTKMPVVADDTGLFVEALNGQPGVYSARYAGEDGNDEKNNALLLKNLEKFENLDDRKAYFETVICFVAENGKVYFSKGRLDGKILKSPRGENGFGYDPLFLVEDKTLAEMDWIEKNSISHRKKALENLKKILETI